MVLPVFKMQSAQHFTQLYSLTPSLANNNHLKLYTSLQGSRKEKVKLTLSRS